MTPNRGSSACSQWVISQETLVNVLIIGELSLDGGVKKVPGILPILLEAKNMDASAA